MASTTTCAWRYCTRTNPKVVFNVLRCRQQRYTQAANVLGVLGAKSGGAVAPHEAQRYHNHGHNHVVPMLTSRHFLYSPTCGLVCAPLATSRRWRRIGNMQRSHSVQDWSSGRSSCVGFTLTPDILDHHRLSHANQPDKGQGHLHQQRLSC